MAVWETGVRLPGSQVAVGADVRLSASKWLWAASLGDDFEGPPTAAAGPAPSIGHFEAVPPEHPSDCAGGIVRG